MYTNQTKKQKNVKIVMEVLKVRDSGETKEKHSLFPIQFPNWMHKISEWHINFSWS